MAPLPPTVVRRRLFLAAILFAVLTASSCVDAAAYAALSRRAARKSKAPVAVGSQSALPASLPEGSIPLPANVVVRCVDATRVRVAEMAATNDDGDHLDGVMRIDSGGHDDTGSRASTTESTATYLDAVKRTAALASRPLATTSTSSATPLLTRAEFATALEASVATIPTDVRRQLRRLFSDGNNGMGVGDASSSLSSSSVANLECNALWGFDDASAWKALADALANFTIDEKAAVERAQEQQQQQQHHQRQQSSDAVLAAQLAARRSPAQVRRALFVRGQ